MMTKSVTYPHPPVFDKIKMFWVPPITRSSHPKPVDQQPRQKRSRMEFSTDNRLSFYALLDISL
jgi:hypothetical protein